MPLLAERQVPVVEPELVVVQMQRALAVEAVPLVAALRLAEPQGLPGRQVERVLGVPTLAVLPGLAFAAQ